MGTRSLWRLYSSRRWPPRRTRWWALSWRPAGGVSVCHKWQASGIRLRLVHPSATRTSSLPPGQAPQRIHTVRPCWGLHQGFTCSTVRISKLQICRGLNLRQVSRTTVLAFSSVALFFPAYGAVTIVGSGNISVTADPSGSYSVTVPDLAWNFTGSVGVPLNNLQTGSGADALGGYSEISFDFEAGAARHASIRTYMEYPDVLFTVSYPSSGAANTFAFPNFAQFPRNLDHLTFSGTFAPPCFWDFASDSPWLFFDTSGKSFILSPAANFMTASTAWGPNGELSSGISPLVLTVPSGFEHRTLLVVETGVNRAFDTWGQALTALGGKTRPANDADVRLNHIGYWTDNGAAYYYHMADTMSYEQTLEAVKGDFDRVGIPLGYLQLDSWFYPKGSNA